MTKMAPWDLAGRGPVALTRNRGGAKAMRDRYPPTRCLHQTFALTPSGRRPHQRLKIGSGSPPSCSSAPTAAGHLRAVSGRESRNHADLLAPFQSEQWGPTVTMQLIGIAYNPTKIQTPPPSWMDLWKPEYKGRVGLTTMESSLGTVFVVEIAKLHGGSSAGEPQPRTRSRRGSASRPWVVVSATNRGSNPACRQ